MPNYAGKERSLQVELPESYALMNKLNRLKLALSHINQKPRAYVYGDKNENGGPSRYLIENDVDGSDGTLSDDYSMLNDTDGDDGIQILLRCLFCDIDIVVCVQYDHLQDVYVFDPEKMICPVCDEKFGEDAISFVQDSISRKKSEKDNNSSGISAMVDKKLLSRGNNNLPVPTFTDFQSSSSDTDSDEDAVSIYSDTSIVASAETELAVDRGDGDDWDGDDDDEEEECLWVKFVRDLVLSTMNI